MVCSAGVGECLICLVLLGDMGRTIKQYYAEFRNVYSDVSVTEWRAIEDLAFGDTPLQVYNDLCRYVGQILDLTGFVDQPEWGHIRTRRDDFTLFQYRDSRDRSAEIFTEYQYRIIEILIEIPEHDDQRALALDDD